MQLPKSIIAISGLLLLGATVAATVPRKKNHDWIDNSLSVSTAQLTKAADAFQNTGKFPRSLMTDYSLEQLVDQLETDHTNFKVELLEHPNLQEFRTVRLCDAADWTSGFFPGSLWLAFELTGDSTLLKRAEKYTNMMLPASYMTDTHDLGFMINCSYGNALRITANDSIPAIIVRAADNLAARFDSRIGCIRSWDFGEWNFPVIIDNMMNLQLLFNASKITGNKKYHDIAVTHARTTMKHHFRPDHTCYHVVSYAADGSLESAGTFQGKNDDSAWARGQGWAVYGFTETYRETGIKEFLTKAVDVAEMIMARTNTADKIPYWDYNARASESTPRDASAAAVIASGFLELGYITDSDKYIDFATTILESLASPQYLATPGSNGGFILMHSVGSLPHGSEIDTPLNYADYYFLEAISRLKRLEQGLPPVEDFLTKA